MSTLAGAFNGLIAYGITKDLDGANGWREWRWIFLIEGIMPCAFAFVILFRLPASPETLKFGFSEEEKALVVRRARNAHNTSEARLQVKKIPFVLLSLHFWLLLGIACCGHFCVGSMSNFLPAIIEVAAHSSSRMGYIADISVSNRALDTTRLIHRCLLSLYTHLHVLGSYSGPGWPIERTREASLLRGRHAVQLLGTRC